MHNPFSSGNGLHLRAAMLVGLLGGLLFSCGEGIRLLPFPASGAAAGNEWESGRRGAYQKNLHRFENQTGRQSVKSPREPLTQPATVAAGPRAPLAAAGQTENPFALPISFRSCILTPNFAGRAPPAQSFTAGV